MTRLSVIALGAGVQSTTVLLLALEGELHADAAIFADTGWEPRAVYEHLARVEAHAGSRIPIHRVQAGNIRDTERQKDFYDAPYFLLNADGSLGMARRQCTQQLKIRPIRWKLRELMAETGATGIDQLFGISVDEWHRMRDSDVKHIRHVYPLVERRWTRQDCHRYLAEHGWEAPRSACIGCPYHSNAEWRQMRDERPDEFADAVLFEREVRGTNAALRGVPFLHAQRVPLDRVDLSTREDHGQLTLDDECSGMCGV